jgi:hypothetical protein
MDVVLVTLGILGVGAIVVATYVFVGAARNYVSEEPIALRGSAENPMVERFGGDRRCGQQVTFPLMVNSILIEKDRRILPDRRRPMAA